MRHSRKLSRTSTPPFPSPRPASRWMRLRPNDTSAVIITYSAAADSRKRAAPVLSIAPALTYLPHSASNRNNCRTLLAGTACLPAFLETVWAQATPAPLLQEFILIWCHDAWHHDETAWRSNYASLPVQKCDTTTVSRNSTTHRFEVTGCYCSFEIGKSTRVGKKKQNLFIEKQMTQNKQVSSSTASTSTVRLRSFQSTQPFVMSQVGHTYYYRLF